MREDIKQLWVEALRSGEYKQTKGVLRDDDGFCCLGVLCEITKDLTGLEWDGGDVGRFVFDDNDTHLGPHVVDTLGIPFTPRVMPDAVEGYSGPVKAGQYYLSDLNDDGMTFDQIADVIEASDL